MNESERLRNLIGSISITEYGDITDDNVGIALASYFESLPECPEDDVDDETGWSEWAMKKADNVLDRIVDVLKKELK